jgi:hypothetical protein
MPKLYIPYRRIMNHHHMTHSGQVLTFCIRCRIMQTVVVGVPFHEVMYPPHLQ